jgi:hypothetical protein
VAETSLPVEHLFTLTANTAGATLVQGGPAGTRVIVGVTGGTFEGPRLRGTIEPPGGDWVTQRADRSIRLDVRITLKTDDGAAILMTYSGIGLPKQGGGLDLRTAPQFETGDERYAWLNNVQAVGIGAPGQGSVTYEVYALK